MIAKHSNAFITDGAVSVASRTHLTHSHKLWGLNLAKSNLSLLLSSQIILVHSFSEVVLKTLLQAKSSNKRFTVYVTSGLDGDRMSNCLKEADIKTILINQSAIGFYMERIDVILVGAESVCEDGGIINEVTLEHCRTGFNPFKQTGYLSAFLFWFIYYLLNFILIALFFSPLISSSSLFSDRYIPGSTVCQDDEQAALCAGRELQIHSTISSQPERYTGASEVQKPTEEQIEKRWACAAGRLHATKFHWSVSHRSGSANNRIDQRCSNSAVPVAVSVALSYRTSIIACNRRKATVSSGF